MATNKLDSSKLTLSFKKELKKPEAIAQAPNVDSLVQSIHNAADEKEKKGESKRTTIDMPKSLHKRIAQHLVEKELTFKEYFAQLVERDLAQYDK